MTDLVAGQTNQRSCVPILVVDDEPCLRYMVARWLGSAGYACAEAESAENAWEYLRNNEVHLVTLDIDMPGMTGSELLGRIKENLPDTEVIMLTGHAETEVAIESLTRGASAYLIKPVNHEELIFQVARALDHRRLYIERRQYTQNLEQKVREQTRTIRRAHEETIHRLVNASTYRDEETGAHIKRVGLVSAMLAESIGWPPAAVDNLRMAASMHDVGKIGVPDAILQKPGKLSPDEFDIMQTHTVIGARMLADAESPMLRMAHDIALCHHERWEGMGYPKGIAESAIPLAARIVAAADVFDALTHDRVYRSALPEPEAVEIMEKSRAKQFDPSLLDLFFGILPDVRQIAFQNPDEPSGELRQPNPVVDVRTATWTEAVSPSL